MKRLIYTIAKEKILAEVSLISSYAGVKSEEDIFCRVALADEDEDLASRFWTDAACEIIDRLREFVVASSINDTSFTLELELSGSYDESLNTSVERDLTSALAYAVISEWFRLTFPGRSSEWATLSAGSLERAHKKLCSRVRPKRLSN